MSRIHPQFRVCFTILYWRIILGFTSERSITIFASRLLTMFFHKVKASINGTLSWSNKTQGLDLFVFQTSHIDFSLQPSMLFVSQQPSLWVNNVFKSWRYLSLFPFAQCLFANYCKLDIHLFLVLSFRKWFCQTRRPGIYMLTPHNAAHYSDDWILICSYSLVATVINSFASLMTSWT